MPVSASLKLLNMAVLSYQEKENYWYIHVKLPFFYELCFDPLTCREHRENFTSHGFEPLVKCKYYLVTMTTEVFIFMTLHQKFVYLN